MELETIQKEVMRLQARCIGEEGRAGIVADYIVRLLREQFVQLGREGVFPPCEYETVDNRDCICFHSSHDIEVDVEKFRIERICNTCLGTLASETFLSLSDLLLNSRFFIDKDIRKVYIVSEK